MSHLNVIVYFFIGDPNSWGVFVTICLISQSHCGLNAIVVFNQDPQKGDLQPLLQLLVEPLLQHQVLEKHDQNKSRQWKCDLFT